MGNNYFFVDGSCLLKDIDEYNKIHNFSPGKKLNLTNFIQYFHKNFEELHSREYKRFVLYFVSGEDRVKDHILIPSKTTPHSLDFEIIYCGTKIKKSKRFMDWIQGHEIPDYVLDRLNKSEKGVDVQICCDGLFLAGLGKIDRLFLYANDSDFIPFCKTIKQLGCNISLFKLSSSRINKDIADVVDTLSSVEENSMDHIFT